eukprot:UN01588
MASIYRNNGFSHVYVCEYGLLTLIDVDKNSKGPGQDPCCTSHFKVYIRNILQRGV